MLPAKKPVATGIDAGDGLGAAGMGDVFYIHVFLIGSVILVAVMSVGALFVLPLI